MNPSRAILNLVAAAALCSQIQAQNGRPSGPRIDPGTRPANLSTCPVFRPADLLGTIIPWEMPAGTRLVNGGFEAGLDGWRVPQRSLIHEASTHQWTTSGMQKSAGQKAGKLSVRERGWGWPGGEFNELYQAVRVEPGGPVTLELCYRPDDSIDGGGQIWVAGFAGRRARCLMLLQWGPKMSVKHGLPRLIDAVLIGGHQGQPGTTEAAPERAGFYWPLPAQGGRWHQVSMNLPATFDGACGRPKAFAGLAIDRLLICLGAWCGDRPGSTSTAWFDELALTHSATRGALSVDGRQLDLTAHGREQLVEPERLDGAAPRAAWSFDGLPLGEPPAGWTIAENHSTKAIARWRVVDEPGAGQVLGVDTANDNATYNLAIASDFRAADVDVSVRVGGNAGTHDQGGGLMWRVQDSENYYVCRINPLENNYRVYKVIGGKRTQLGTVDVDTPAGKWFTVGVTMIGEHVTCQLDGRPLLEVRDGTITAPGRIGLWTKADASSSFDDLVCTAAPASRPSE